MVEEDEGGRDHVVGELACEIAAEERVGEWERRLGLGLGAIGRTGGEVPVGPAGIDVVAVGAAEERVLARGDLEAAGLEAAEDEVERAAAAWAVGVVDLEDDLGDFVPVGVADAVEDEVLGALDVDFEEIDAEEVVTADDVGEGGEAAREVDGVEAAVEELVGVGEELGGVGSALVEGIGEKAFDDVELGEGIGEGGEAGHHGVAGIEGEVVGVLAVGEAQVEEGDGGAEWGDVALEGVEDWGDGLEGEDVGVWARVGDEESEHADVGADVEDTGGVREDDAVLEIAEVVEDLAVEVEGFVAVEIGDGDAVGEAIGVGREGRGVGSEGRHRRRGGRDLAGRGGGRRRHRGRREGGGGGARFRRVRCDGRGA